MSEKVTIQGPVGKLEAEIWLPEGGAPAKAAAVVCHPHPLHGGTMRNNVVHRTARGLHDAGLAVVRFNFRGVGGSEGTHDGNGAEEEDLAAALTFLRERVPGVPLWAAGFSFGSRTVIGLAPRDERIERVALIALPVIAYDCSVALEVKQPGGIFMAGDDTFGTMAVMRDRLPDLFDRFHVEEVPGVDHFFTGKLDDLRLRVKNWAAASLPS
jgi:alpha/beta superfamily hydrolase